MIKKGCGSSRRPALTISTPEGRAIPVALRAYFREVPSSHCSRVHVVPTCSDSEGNGAA